MQRRRSPRTSHRRRTKTKKGLPSHKSRSEQDEFRGGYREGYRVAYRDAYNDAYEKAYEEAYDKAYDEAYDGAYEDAYEDAYNEAREDAYEDAYASSRKAAYARKAASYKDSDRAEARKSCTKVFKQKVDTRTLDAFELPWEWYPADKDCILIKDYVSPTGLELLFLHTHRLREAEQNFESLMNPRPLGNRSDVNTREKQ